MSQSESADLAHIRHLPWFVGFLHVFQKNLLGCKGKFTDLTSGWNHRIKVTTLVLNKQGLFTTKAVRFGRTWGFDWAVGTLDVALQLERSHIFPIAMMASGVAVPALTVLLLQLQVVLHVVHEPAEMVHTCTQTQKHLYEIGREIDKCLSKKWTWLIYFNNLGG